MKHAIIRETLALAWLLGMVGAAVLLTVAAPKAEFFWAFVCGMLATGGSMFIKAAMGYFDQ